MSKQRMMPAINLALQEEMKRDDKVILYGEDAGISLFRADNRSSRKFW